MRGEEPEVLRCDSLVEPRGTFHALTDAPYFSDHISQALVAGAVYDEEAAAAIYIFRSVALSQCLKVIRLPEVTEGDNLS